MPGKITLSLSCQFDGVYIVSGSLDTHIRVWKADNGQCIHVLKGKDLLRKVVT